MQFAKLKREVRKIFDAIELGKYIIHKCVSEKQLITNLQLQKILVLLDRFFSQRNIQLFHNKIEKRKFGYIVPDAYYFFCFHGSSPIHIAFDDWGDIRIDKGYKRIIDIIVERKRVLNAWEI